MQTWTDAQLLGDYARHKSETAFGEIVRRHANLVYSAACRQTGDAEEARDVTQMVFADLAKKAGAIGAKAVLVGWLYRAVRLQALELRRNDLRRQRREKEAMANLDSSSEPPGDWTAVRPVLDDAMSTLTEEDRDALLLRFFKNESLAEVGSVLGVTEDAAQKRVSRALARLRDLLAHRGINTSAAALSVALAAGARESAPEGLTAACLSGAVTGGPVAAPGFWAMPGLKTVLVTAALAGGLVALTVRQADLLRQRDALEATLQFQANELALLRAETNRLALRPTDANDEARQRELARLRANTERLRSDLEAAQAHEKLLAQRLESNGLSKEATPRNPANPQVLIDSRFFLCTTNSFNVLAPSATGYLTSSEARALYQAVTNDPNADVIWAPRMTTLSNIRGHLAMEKPVMFEGGETNVGLSVDVLPIFSASSDTINLAVMLHGSRLNEQSVVEEFNAHTTLDVPNGRTVVMTSKLPGKGPWFDNDAANYDGERLLVALVTAQMIDPAGNPIYTSETNAPSPNPGADQAANPSGFFPASASPQ